MFFPSYPFSTSKRKAVDKLKLVFLMWLKYHLCSLGSDDLNVRYVIHHNTNFRPSTCFSFMEHLTAKIFLEWKGIQSQDNKKGGYRWLGAEQWCETSERLQTFSNSCCHLRHWQPHHPVVNHDATWLTIFANSWEIDVCKKSNSTINAKKCLNTIGSRGIVGKK